MKSVADVTIVGAGVAGLTSGVLLAAEGKQVRVLEQNWIPGGCASSYPRKHFVFETGATTLVGLDENMPLKYVLERTGIQPEVLHLKTPMKVHLSNGEVVTRYEGLEEWISEAERVFGPDGQRAFWLECYRISQFVWKSSLQQPVFPPTRISDLWLAAKRITWEQVRNLPSAFRSTLSLLNKHGLEDNRLFREFVDEQLLITAQNFAEEVNVLFGATALCYTNYYVPGGMINLVNPMVKFIEENGGEVLLRTQVVRIAEGGPGYRVSTLKKGDFDSRYVLSAIPLNNTLPIFGEALESKWKGQMMPSRMLRSAFQMGIAFKKHRDFDCVHHQLHLSEPLKKIGANSLFLSLNHPCDKTRCGEGEAVASISTHVFDPDNTMVEHSKELEERILDELEAKDFLQRENILYRHSSTPGAWEKWTGRKWGFVGGYPQYMNIKPWQMKDARLDGKGAYICGDSTYPGQGIPGACLSGIIAVEKMRLDHFGQ